MKKTSHPCPVYRRISRNSQTPARPSKIDASVAANFASRERPNLKSVGRTIFSRGGRWNTLHDETVRSFVEGGDQGGSSSRAVALHEVPMAQGNTYPVVGSASYSSLESRRLPPMAPPTRDTTFNPHTPPMASYYYHCARAACLFHLRPPPSSRGCSTSSYAPRRATSKSLSCVQVLL